MSTPEDVYIASVSREHRSEFGQFFTPPLIAELMALWVKEINPLTILEPSVGSGILARVAKQHLPDSHITCVDVDEEPLKLVRESLSGCGNATVMQADFLTMGDHGLFDAALANPPYLRHQNLDYPFDIHAEISLRNQCSISKLSNIYLLFVFEICRRLKPGGRAAIIIPSEWMNANFGASLKSYFSRTGYLRKIIHFPPEVLNFEGVLTTSCILLIEKVLDTPSVLDVLCIDAIHSALLSEGYLFDGKVQVPGVTRKSFSWHTLMNTSKWERLFTVGHSTPSSHLIPLRDLCRSRRGITTGANDFFHVSRCVAEQHGISAHHQKPCIGPVKDIKGFIFSSADFSSLESMHVKTRLLSFDDSLSENDLLYIFSGEKSGLPSRFILKNRKPWFSMEKYQPAPILVSVFNRQRIRFILNPDLILNLTNFHALYPLALSDMQTHALVALLNSTPLQAKITLHCRSYGGGLLKLEPKDVLDIEVPDVRLLNKSVCLELSHLLHSLDSDVRHHSKAVSARLDAIASAIIDNEFM